MHQKTRQLYCFLSHQILIVAQKLTKYGQKKMFLALIWGIVHSFRSYMTREMITKLKNFDRIFLKELQIWHFLKNQIFRFLIKSLIIFDIQECTIPQTKAKDILFWPYFVRFLATINTLWDRRQWSCLVFFDSDFT